jgi:hypothetical protein
MNVQHKRNVGGGDRIEIGESTWKFEINSGSLAHLHWWVQSAQL